MPQDNRDFLPVTPAVVSWARQRAGFSIEDAAKYFRKIEAWEAGTAAPSYPQLEQMADKFKCPVAVFFFPAPPDVPAVEKSFRTIDPKDLAALPRVLRILLRRAQAMQLNLSELNEGRNSSTRFVTRDLRFNVDTPIRVIAAKLREYLRVPLEEQMKWPDIEGALEQWREVFTSVGIYVFKDAFHTERYFGFCLYDEQFPIIYINNSSTKSRQIFTLFHELGHLLFHTSGIDLAADGTAAAPSIEAKRIEVICNRLAGAFLVPDDALRSALGRTQPDRDAATALAARFNVSREVIYRRFLDHGLISKDEYSKAANFWINQIKKPAGSRGNYYSTLFSYLGRDYINLVFRRYHQNRFDDIQLSEYLNIKPRNLATFELKYAGGQ